MIMCFNVSIYSLLYVYCIIAVCASEPHSSEFNATISVCLSVWYVMLNLCYNLRFLRNSRITMCTVRESRSLLAVQMNGTRES